ncbi:bZIP transcription factor 29-like [Silene latifolia]|uniref:bZIP transcription factor 29-like n=1 Tax=Silene latifolia TaxID=37657 RepID=UPI003D76DD7A
MDGSDDKGRIDSSFANCSSSPVVNQGNNNMLEGNYGRRTVGIPPSHPHSHFGGLVKLGGEGDAQKPSHSRSLSQPSFLSFDQLPPLSPSMFRESNTTPFDRGLNEVNNVQGLSLPPRRGGHRRSSSDIPLGFDVCTQSQFSQPEKPAQLVLKREVDWGTDAGGGGGMGKGELIDDLLSVYMNFDGIDALNSSSMEDKDSRASGTRTNESSENEVESSGISSNSVERRETGKTSAVPTGRHSRSLSMDSFMGNLNLNDELLSRIPPSPGIRSSHHSRNNSMDGSTSMFRLEFGNGEFSPQELNKIMANQKLAEVARVDPKRVKRILANRVSAARSKERKVRYISELEYKVQTLQREATSLSAQLTILQRDSVGLATQNNELRFRLQAMEQQAHLRDALNEALGAEFQRLKIAAQMKGICSAQDSMASNRVFQMQPSQNFQEQADSSQSEHRQSGQS